MEPCQDCMELLKRKLVEIDTTPDLSKYKPVVILKQGEFGKLLAQLETMKEAWIAMKFNDTIFVVWKELIFLHVANACKDEVSNGCDGEK